MKIEFGLATQHDDQDLRRLIASIPIPGNISMIYTREPSFFDSVNIMGKKSDVFIAKKNGDILAQGMASYLDCYINGEAKEIGYLSSLRIEEQLRTTRCVFQGFDFVKKLDADRNIPFYLSTIIEDNHAARKVLTSNRMSIPKYIDIGRYITYAILLQKCNHSIFQSAYNIKNIIDERELNSIIDFINKEGSKKQFYPVYTKKDLMGFKGFDFRNLWGCYDHNELIGVIGCWDQSSFKQTIVNGYHGKWKIIKPIYNLLSPLMGYKRLPQCGEKIEYLYLSFVAIKDNQPKIYESILKHIYRLYANSKYHYIIVGLHEYDPLNKALSSFKSIKYNSRMYVVSYKPVDMQSLNKNGIPYLECARL